MARYEVSQWYAYVLEVTRGMNAQTAARRAGLNPSAFTRWKGGLGADPKIVVQFARAHGLNVLEALAAAELITEDEATGLVQDTRELSTELLLEELGRRAGVTK